MIFLRAANIGLILWKNKGRILKNDFGNHKK